MKQIYVFLFFILAGNQLFAEFRFPSNLSKNDRTTALRVLGFGSSVKTLSDPYPLGGYDGFEVGLSTEIINTVDLSRLGNKNNMQSELAYYNLTFGKGLFKNVDMFVQFTPPIQNVDVSNYGGQIRWTFFEGNYLPFYTTFILHASNTNFANQIITSTSGYDILGSVNVDGVTLFFGGGPAKTSGTFVGGNEGITDTGEQTSESATDSHFTTGVNLRLPQKSFLAFEIDRYSESIYSLKYGFRF